MRQNRTLSSDTGDFLMYTFNLYLHSLDKFVEKIMKSVTKTDRKKLNLEYKKITRSDSSKIEKLLTKVRYKITKKQRKLTKRLETRKLINDSEKMAGRIYYARYTDDFILGFSMSKSQTKLIMENITKFITNDLKFEVIKTTLKHTINDKTLFLGFEIRMILPEKFHYSRSKKLETYKRYKNMILKKGAQEYKKFLKMIEWLGRRSIASVVNKKISSEKYIVKTKELKKIIPEAIQQEN